MDQIITEAFDGPFLLVAQAPSVKCQKCGRDTVPPGRIAIFDGTTMRTWCDCITEEEMQAVVREYVGIKALWTLNPGVVHA